MSKHLGHIKAATIMLDNVMKCEKMDYKSICLMTGKNGSGKTLVMKNIWIINVLSNYIICGLVSPAVTFDLKHEAQFVFTNTFDNCDFTGYVQGFFEDCDVRIELEEGKVTKIEHNFPNDLLPMSFPIYMSGQTRTFDTFIKYMQFKKAIGITKMLSLLSTAEMNKLLGVYKLYDILFIEGALVRLNGKVIPDELKKQLKEQYDIRAEFDQILVDTEECTMVNYERDTKKTTPLTRYSAGEQSLLNMLLAAG